ncbi:MAG: STAS domain-containing protein [candidate division WOR-3 bacterium]
MKNFDKQVRYRKEGEYCVVRFLGSLDTAYRESLIMFFDDRMREDCKYFILDFEKTDYMSSTVWGALITITKRARERGGDVYLCAVHGQLESIFRIMRFDKIFKVYPDVYT